MPSLISLAGANSIVQQPANADQAIKSLVKQFDSIDCAERVNDAIKRQRIFDGDYDQYLEELLAEQYCERNYERLKKLKCLYFNVLRRILDRTSLVYSGEATRSVDKNDKAYQDFLTLINMDNYGRKINKLVRLHKLLGLRPVVRGGRPCIDILHAGNTRIISSKEDPMQPMAVMYEVTSHYLEQDNKAKTILSRKDRKYVYMDSGMIAMVDHNGYPIRNDENPDRINPFGEIPIVWARDDVHDGTDFWPCDPSSDLVHATLELSVQKTFLSRAIQTSCYKQLYTITENPEEEQGEEVLDPTSMIQFRDAGGVLDMQIDLNQITQTIRSNLEDICSAYGMSLADFQVSNQVQSGESRKVANSSLIESVKQQRVMMRQIEKDLYRMCAVVYSYEGIANLDPSATLTVDFEEMDIEKPDMLEWEMDQKKLENNLISYVDYYKKWIDSDFASEDAVIKKIEENRAMNQRLSQRGLLFSQPEGQEVQPPEVVPAS